MKILFLINTSRREAAPQTELVDEFHNALHGAGVDYEIRLCETLEQTAQWLKQMRGEGFDTLWIGGGDGTINDALNHTIGQGLIYGIVPMGTVNALARALGLPEDPLNAVHYLLGATPTPMDAGRVNGHHFLTYATVGIHAAVFHNINTSLKRRWGKLAFWESALRTVWQKSRLPRFIMEMELADVPVKERQIRDYGYSFTLGNVANFVGFDTLTADAPAMPGCFMLHSFRRNRLGPMMLWLAMLRWLGIRQSRPATGHYLRRVRWVKVRSHRKLSLQIDGEPIKPTDRKNLHFECLPDAIMILLQPDHAQEEDQEPPGV